MNINLNEQKLVIDWDNDRRIVSADDTHHVIYGRDLLCPNNILSNIVGVHNYYCVGRVFSPQKTLTSIHHYLQNSPDCLPIDAKKIIMAMDDFYSKVYPSEYQQGDYLRQKHTV